MTRLWMLAPAVLLSAAISFAQTPNTPAPTPQPGQGQRPVNPITADNAKYDRLRSIELMTPSSREPQHPLLDPKKGIYRTPGQEETEILAVSDILLVRYAFLLKEQNTGIVKLSSKAECVSDPLVVEASENCIGYTMPGAGISFSFRTETYRLPRISDLILDGGIFKTGGVLQQVVMVDVGDVPIEAVNLSTPGIKFLVDMKPVRDNKEFIRFEEKILEGFTEGGHFYRRGHLAKENSTYLLRSIAYRGQYFQTIEGEVYDELSFDRRRDVIVAFRVVEKDAEGNLTIVWKRLRDVDAPRLRIFR